jgi:glycosyltransferase involved in cell wall biosynthesis
MMQWPGDYPRPVALHMGRVAVDKNIEAFLVLPGLPSKVVIRDGPDLERLRTRYPRAHFLGAYYGRELAWRVAGGDVFVFPSRTDTFGLVLLEAMACGLPVAAYPVQGPLDVSADGVSGALDVELGRALERALTLYRSACVARASRFSWASATADFAAHMAPFDVEGTVRLAATEGDTA